MQSELMVIVSFLLNFKLSIFILNYVTNKQKTESSAVTVVVVLLVLALVAGGGFIAYRRYQSGQLQLPFLDRFLNPIPASTTTTLPTSAANDDHPIAFQNDNHVG